MRQEQDLPCPLWIRIMSLVGSKRKLYMDTQWLFHRGRIWLMLREKMATHSSILAWRIPWTEELGGLQSTGRRVGHDWATSLSEEKNKTKNPGNKHSVFISLTTSTGIPCRVGLSSSSGPGIRQCWFCHILKLSLQEWSLFSKVGNRSVGGS